MKNKIINKQSDKFRYNLVKLVLCVVLVLSIGFFGSFFTSQSVNTWFKTIDKPFFSPPNWLFGPVWTILYIMIGISLYLVITSRADKEKKRKVEIIFAIQLFLNFLWSLIFFGNQNIGLAFIEIVLLWIAILINLILAWKISKAAGWLLVPYFLWVSFASILNFSLWMLN